MPDEIQPVSVDRPPEQTPAQFATSRAYAEQQPRSVTSRATDYLLGQKPQTVGIFLGVAALFYAIYGVGSYLPTLMLKHETQIEKRNASQELIVDKHEKQMDRYWQSRNKDIERTSTAIEKSAENVGKLSITVDKMADALQRYERKANP